MFDKTQYSVGLFLNCLAWVSDDSWLLPPAQAQFEK